MLDLREPVDDLGELVERVRYLRDQFWGLPKHKELWFRGESRDYRQTTLRPELYRPVNGKVVLKPTLKLLEIEHGLYEEFQRIAVERCQDVALPADWEWDSYFLMQHHSGVTRLLDWSDGALMATHFALRNKRDIENARIYVLEPYRLLDRLGELPEVRSAQEDWRAYIAKHPSYELEEDDWDNAYLPSDDEDIKLPIPPLVMEFPLITRRIAAQRSRFILFGTDPNWLSNELKREDSVIQIIEIAGSATSKIRQQLRDCGVTESVIYPDLDGLGREMRQLWEDRRDAAEENS